MNATIPNNKKIWFLAVFTALTAVVFSFMGAPFLRALFAKSKPVFYWGLGAVLAGILFSVQLTLGAIYVGAVWMTLGLYSELETRGVSWKKATTLSAVIGLIFGGVLFFISARGGNADLLMQQLTEPLMQTLKNVAPQAELSTALILSYMPGIFLSLLMGAIAMGLAFESRVFELFSLRREKTASALRWLEFKLPDLFIWISLFSFLFSLWSFGEGLNLKGLKLVSINIAIVSLTCFFIQGVVVFEFLSRYYRWGQFTKLAMYMLMLLWLGPAVILVGLSDYWLDYRGRIRKKMK